MRCSKRWYVPKHYHALEYQSRRTNRKSGFKHFLPEHWYGPNKKHHKIRCLFRLWKCYHLWVVISIAWWKGKDIWLNELKKLGNCMFLKKEYIDLFFCDNWSWQICNNQEPTTIEWTEMTFWVYGVWSILVRFGNKLWHNPPNIPFMRLI